MTSKQSHKDTDAFSSRSHDNPKNHVPEERTSGAASETRYSKSKAYPGTDRVKEFPVRLDFLSST